jgi:hypothetical protein
MPLFQDQALTGTDFDGTPGNGELDFGLATGNDGERAMIMNVGLSSPINVDTFFFRLASSKVQLDAGDYIELGFNGSASLGGSIYGCEIVVPVDWFFYCVTSGLTAATKFLTVDWRAVTFTTAR